MELQVSIPIDDDGFLRRECPSCVGQFKWHHGPASEAAETAPAAEIYFCPLCGVSATVDQWWTQEQLEYAQGVAVPQFMNEFTEELRDAVRQPRDSFIQLSVETPDVADAPAPLVEPNDMEIVASPCHAYEPVKVPETLRGPFFCLVCGTEFAV